MKKMCDNCKKIVKVLHLLKDKKLCNVCYFKNK